MSQLATIQRVLNIQPIAGADAIELATVLGWQVVVKKGEFAPGDLCIYAEIDSVLPDQPAFEFLRAKKFRIRTVRLRGQISQGICFPLGLLPEGIAPTEGADVTDALGITKWEPPVPAGLAGVMRGSFPSFIPKTDETRAQSLQQELAQHAGLRCYATEKLDGTSITIYLRDGEFGVCSRNMDLEETPDSLYWQAARALNLEAKMRALGTNIALQGELVGPGIQGNRLKLAEKEIYFFSCFLIDEYRYAGFEALRDTCAMLGLKMALVVAHDFALSTDIAGLLQMATRKSVLNEAVWAEGIVVRTLDLKDHFSFKAINNEFLLAHGD